MAPPPLDRAQFAVTDRWRYLDHASMGVLPQAAVQAATTLLDEHATGGSTHRQAWEGQVEAVRASAARLLGVDAADLAFVKNTTEGLAFVANGLTWSEGDRVLVPGHEFPSTALPWLALEDRGVEVDRLAPVGDAWAIPLERIDEHLRTRPTRLVALSWVNYARGWRTDLAALAAICHRHGALLCVDAIQGLGVIPADLDAWGVDFAAADAYKWLLGPLGAGVLYVARRNRDLLRPQEPGWASAADLDAFDDRALTFADSARRFEGGSLTTGAIVQVGASIDLLLAAGVEAVWRHVDALTDRLADGLTEAGAVVRSSRAPDTRSGIVSATVGGHEPATVVARLRDLGVACSPRGDAVRFSPHGYTSLDDIDGAVDAVRRATSP